MHFGDLNELAASLLIVSAITKVLLDIARRNMTVVDNSGNIKAALSILFALVVVLVTDISLFEPTVGYVHYIGVVAAGLVAGLGSNFINEVMGALSSVKDLKEKKF